jgi:hypothetical protein
VKLDHQWMLTRLEIHGDQDADFDLMFTYLLVGSPVDMEAVEAGGSCSIVKWRHIKQCSRNRCWLAQPEEGVRVR